MVAKEYPSAELIRQLLDYDLETGVFTWKHRPVEMFVDGKQSAERNCAIWNGKFAGKIAGCASGHGYWLIRVNDRIYGAHRLAWTYVHGETPIGDIDHINMNGTDNRISNLRSASRSQNMANTNAHRDNFSAVKGVYFNKRTSKWCARIHVDGKRIALGSFDTPEAAGSAYNDAAKAFFGQFARTQDQ